MGWKLKTLAFIFAFPSIYFRAWIIAVPLLLYVFSGPIFLIFRRKGQSYRNESAQTTKVAWKPKRARPLVNAMAVILLLVALFAFLTGGKFSPFVFASLGFAILVWGPLSRSSHFATAHPVKDSILLRGSLDRFSWLALTEVKLLTHDVGKALSAVSEKILVVASEKPTIYVSVRVTALGHKSAEEKILERFKEVNKIVAPLGAYLLPLDCERSAKILGVSVEPIEVNHENLSPFLSSTPYDLVSLETEGGYVKSIGVYGIVESRKDRKSASVPSRKILPKPPLTSEVFRSIGTRIDWPNPDEYTAFLTSMLATQYASPENRVVESGGSSSQQVVVRSLGSPAVEVSRAQLNATASIYAR